MTHLLLSFQCGQRRERGSNPCAAAGRRTKRKAFTILTITACVSGSVNFLAPAPPLVKGLAAFVTVAILMAESLRNLADDVNFNKMEQIEQDIATGKPVKAAAVVDKNLEKARKAAGYYDMDARAARNSAWIASSRAGSEATPGA